MPGCYFCNFYEQKAAFTHLSFLGTIENFRLNIEYLRLACGGSNLNKTERSDIHKSSIYNLQSSIPVLPEQGVDRARYTKAL